ncbi:MAG TPA: HEAT repeat domain-containing protein [candidate division Zixibacteria bacterium]|nr:HEAT repeat domain-containing protein [candidate division Zixibacteria bacterium]
MSLNNQTVNEADLNLSLNEIAHAITRELAMTARKVAIYGSDHPLVAKAVAKPFAEFNKAFRFKRHVNFQVYQGQLYVLNFRLRDSVFCTELLRYLQILDVNAVLFERRLTVAELIGFIGRMVMRTSRTDHDNLMVRYLKEKKCDTISANSREAFNQFELSRQFRGDIDGDYSVKAVMLELMGDDPIKLSHLIETGEAEDPFLADFERDYIEYLMPEAASQLTVDDVERGLSRLQREYSDGKVTEEAFVGIRKLLNYHGDRERIMNRIEALLKNSEHADVISNSLTTPAGAIRMEAADQIDQIMATCFESTLSPENQVAFASAFGRILRTGQRGKAIQVIEKLLDCLEKPESGTRLRALELLLATVDLIELPTHNSLCDETVLSVVARINARRETFEYSEFIWRLVKKLALARQYEQMAALVSALAARRQVGDTVTIYDSMAVKKALSNIDRSEVINSLIDQMLTADNKTSRVLRQILVAIGSERVAMALSNIISHPVRQVRQHALKILAELGRSSLKVFTRLLQDNNLFTREAGRYELPDAKWYIVRNSIFVLGSLGDPDGVAPLRLHINDKDVRVRREIISALEKIGGEESFDLLILMADDTDLDVARTAVIAAGLIGSPEAAAQLYDVAERHPALSPKVIFALGKLGGPEALKVLIRLLANEDELADLGKGQVSRDEMRLAVVKALGTIGEDEALLQLRKYQESQSTTQKILFKNTAVNKAVAEILSRTDAD